MIEKYDRACTLSKCRQYMYRLWWKWSVDKKWCVFIMLNPATTNTNGLSKNKTVLNCKTIAESEGCGGIILLDLFSYATKVGSMLVEAKSKNEDIIGPNHKKYIESVLRIPNTLIIAAWGDTNDGRRRPDDFKETIKFYEQIEETKRIIKEQTSYNKIKCLKNKIRHDEIISHPYWLAWIDKYKSEEQIKQEVLENYKLEDFVL